MKVAGKISFSMLFAVLFLAPISGVFADVSFNSPTTDSAIDACKDYFTSEWASRLDMTNASPHGDLLYNIVPAEVAQLGAYNYSGGIMTTTATGTTPYFRVLTNAATGQLIDEVTRYGDAHPVDSSTYSVFTFRMYSSQDSSYSIRWDKADQSSWAITDLAPSYSGWHTYSVNLPSATAALHQGTYQWGSGNNIGLAVYPSRDASGGTIKLDWLQLTPAAASCSAIAATYHGTSGDVYSLFVDDDTDPSTYQQRTLPAVATGSTESTSFSSNLFYPGTYKVSAISSPDYATHFFNPWDFSDSTDIQSARTSHVSNLTFSNGKMCGTVSAADPNVYLNIPGSNAINSSIFNKASFSYQGGAGTIQVLFFDTSSNFVGARNIDVTGSGTYQLNLASGLSHAADAGTWTGNIGLIRIDPEIGTGSTFCFDWFSVGSAYTNTEPTTATAVVASGQTTINPRKIAPMKQPDNEGGEDYFVKVRGKPGNLSAATDVDRGLNLANGTVYPGKSYTDNGGNVYIGDYLEGLNVQGKGDSDGDPQVFFVLRDDDTPIDASKYKLTCFTMNLPERGVALDHTVVRLGWERDSNGNGSIDTDEGFTGDDIVLKTSGQARYCHRLEGMPIERNTTTINGQFWLNNPDNSFLHTFRLDPHEIGESTKFRIADMRLAADHQTNTQFAVVVGGDRDTAVSVYKNSSNSTSGGTLIGTLSANRTSDVLLWNTTAETDGTTYYLYASVGGSSFLAPGRVVINHSYTDATAPVLHLDAPASDGSGSYNALDLAGYALDDVRLATVEVTIDSTLVDSFLPTNFNLDVRNNATYGTMPFVSSAGFQKSIDLSAYANGSHMLKVDAYDTAGNKTTYTTTFTKASSNVTSPISYSVPNESGQSIALTDPAAPGTNLTLSASISNGDIQYSLAGFNNCTQVRLKIADTAAKVEANNGVGFITSITDAATIAAGSINLYTPSPRRLVFKKKASKKVKAKKYFYVGADCGSNGINTATIKLDATKAGTKALKVTTLKAFMQLIVNSAVPAS